MSFLDDRRDFISVIWTGSFLGEHQRLLFILCPSSPFFCLVFSTNNYASLEKLEKLDQDLWCLVLALFWNIWKLTEKNKVQQTFDTIRILYIKVLFLVIVLEPILCVLIVPMYGLSLQLVKSHILQQCFHYIKILIFEM